MARMPTTFADMPNLNRRQFTVLGTALLAGTAQAGASSLLAAVAVAKAMRR